MNSQKMIFLFFFLRKCIWRQRGEAWRERLRCSLKEGSHRDKRYQIDEGDDEPGCRRRDTISLNCNHCCCQQSWHSSGWKILHSGRKRETHKRNWVFPFCTIETATLVVTAKLKSSKHQRNYCWPVLVLTLQMWLCKTGFLVRWLQHFDFVEQFSNTRGILIFILFSLLVKEGLNNNNEIRITFIKKT